MHKYHSHTHVNRRRTHQQSRFRGHENRHKTNRTYYLCNYMFCKRQRYTISTQVITILVQKWRYTTRSTFWRWTYEHWTLTFLSYFETATWWVERYELSVEWEGSIPKIRWHVLLQRLSTSLNYWSKLIRRPNDLH